MSKTCVIVADRARARLFVLESPPSHVRQAPPRLREVDALANPDGELTGSQLFSSAHSGRNRAPHGAAFEYDEHRQDCERRFAKEIVTAAVAFIRLQRARKLVLAAEPRLLGLLREVLPSLLPDDIALVALARDLSKQTPDRIRSALDKHGAFTKSN